MIRQMVALLRIKELKQERALSAMRACREQLARAREATREAFEIAEAFRITIPEREDAAYAKIMKKIVDIDGIDNVKAEIIDIEKEYTALRDDWDRARQIEARREKELDEAVAAYRAAVKTRDKYITITDEMRTQAEEEAMLREEVEIEDLFARPARRFA